MSSIGKVIDPFKASKIGFSVLFIGEQRKLVKMYYDKISSKSYNVSIISDKINRITAIEIYEIVQTGPQGASIGRIQITSPSITSEIKKDLAEIIGM